MAEPFCRNTIMEAEIKTDYKRLHRHNMFYVSYTLRAATFCNHCLCLLFQERATKAEKTNSKLKQEISSLQVILLILFRQSGPSQQTYQGRSPQNIACSWVGLST